MNSIYSRIKGDKVIWVTVFLLSVFSLLVVYSSTGALAYKSKGGNTEAFLIKHGFIMFAGLFLMYLTHRIKINVYYAMAQFGIFVAAPLLLFTLLKGVSAGDASRWLEIPGTSLTFQTSDLAKVALIMYIARALSNRQNMVGDFKQMNDLRKGWIPIMLPIFIICGLILPANFSTAALLFVTSAVMLFVGRVSLKFLVLIASSAILMFILFIVLVLAFPNVNSRVATWKSRIENFSSGSSDKNYQAEQAMIAIATGGPLGKGPGKSTQRNFLPQASSDFVFAIMIEEYGSVIGGSFVLFLYLILLHRSVRIVTKSEKTFSGILAFGLSFSLVFQALINMAVAVHIFPVTGQPLPFISMGGTSIWFSAINIGMVLGLSRETEKEEAVAHETT